MLHMPTTTSADTMEAKEFKEVEHDNKMRLAGDHHEITSVDKDTGIRSDETGSCTLGLDWKFNHPSREENVEGKLEEAVSGQKRLAKFKGAQGLGNIASSENVGQIECKLNFLGLPIRPGEKKCPFYMRTGGCKFARRCRFHHPDPTAVVGDSFQDRKNGVPSQRHDPVEQFCETPRPSENSSNEQTAFLGAFTPNRGLQQNVHWNGNQTATSPLHTREMNINDPRKALANKDTAYEFSGGVESQQFEEYPQRPSEPECQYFMKTGYCKFKSACRYHHPKSNVSFLGLPQRPVSNNYQHHGPVEQLRETPLPSEKTSNEQTAFLGPSSSYVPDLLTTNQGLKPNAQWNGNQTVTSLLHPPEIKIIDQQKELANKDAAYEVSGGEPQQFDEYPQRPSEPECQYFMKTGYCKFKSACRFHHSKSNPSFLGLRLRPASNNYKQDGPVEQLCEVPLPSESTSNEQTAFVCPSSSNVADLFTPNRGLQPNVQWNGYQTVTSLLHPPEIKIIDQQKELANKDAAYEVSGGEPQQFDEYPQRPSEPECQYFMKTGYCKFKSACRFHHPKSNPSFLGFPLRPASNNYKQDGPVEQLCEMALPSESTSNEQTAFVCPSSSNVAGLFTSNRELQPNVQWNGDLMATSPLHPPEIKIIEAVQELANKDTAYEFSGGVKSQQFDEYPQRPSEPECQYFMKTGYCKFKSACRCHHPKSNLSFPAPPLKPMATSPLHPPDIEINEQGQELANKDTAYEFSGGVKLQQFDEYPQRPSEPECQYFMKTGYCKFKSACRCHHPKSNLSFPAPPPKSDKPICTHYSRRGNCKFGSACRFNHHMEHT